MGFKDQIAKDIVTVFMNMEEFAETHTIDGKKMDVMIDSNELVDRGKRYQYKKSLYSDGVYRKELLIYVSASEFGVLPAIGRAMNFDGKKYIVSDAIDEDGIYSIYLEANRA